MSEDQQIVAQVYAELSAEFDHTFHREGGGASLEYLTGEQIVSRLNEVLGFGGWSFRVVEHGFDEVATEYWALGELLVLTPAGWVYRQQFGSQKQKRAKSNQVPLDIGFDLKGAATDALKKCASLIGVGLYLYEKEPQDVRPQARRPDARPATPKPAMPKAAEEKPAEQPAQTAEVVPPCSVCQEVLKPVKFGNGTVWTPGDLARSGMDRFKLVLCLNHYKQHADAEKLREEASV